MLWNVNILKVEEIIKGTNFILVAGRWDKEELLLNMVNVYAPTDNSERKLLWDHLMNLKASRNNAAWLMMGDFNEVTCVGDRFSERLCISSMNDFISFINKAELFEYQMGARKFTWMSADGSRLSKIDRFLACNRFVSRWVNASVVALPRLNSDHSPLTLLCEFSNSVLVPSAFSILGAQCKVSLKSSTTIGLLMTLACMVMLDF